MIGEPRDGVGKETSTPRVSVIIPAYNSAAFLPSTLESVFAQTLPAAEIIVVDDGSKDSTEGVARSYSNRVRYLKKENGGPASARNAGVLAATGEWIAFLDADDRWVPNKLSEQMRVAAVTGADFICSDAAMEISGDQVVSWLEKNGTWPRLQGYLTNPVLPDPFEMLLRIGCFVLTSTVVARRQVVVDAGLFDVNLFGTEDIDLWLRIAYQHRVALLPTRLIMRQVHDSNITGNNGRMIKEQIKVWEKLDRFPAIQMNRAWRKLLHGRKANDYWDEGYWHFSRDELSDARASWTKSLRARFSVRVAAFWFASLLPRTSLKVLRSAARRLRGAADPDDPRRSDGEPESLKVRQR